MSMNSLSILDPAPSIEHLPQLQYRRATDEATIAILIESCPEPFLDHDEYRSWYDMLCAALVRDQVSTL